MAREEPPVAMPQQPQLKEDESSSVMITGHTDVALADPPHHPPPKERETWDSKIEFLLSVVGFAVDLGNVWRFPYICFRNGGGAFLVPYMIMYVFVGLPLFYMELALGQFHRSGCITVWRRICPLFEGIGFAICITAFYMGCYYNTVMAWALFYLFDSFRAQVPWASCNNWWNTKNCIDAMGRMNGTNLNQGSSSTEEYFFTRVLHLGPDIDFDNVGQIRWEIALCLLAIFVLVYFSVWKGVKSSGKAVWITATVPYIVLLILLVRGLLLEGSLTGIKYYLTPNFTKLKEIEVWQEASAQIFFSLGPGFGVLLALSSYNKDAMVTSVINCLTSFLAGFVVFSVLGYMCHQMKREMSSVANAGPELVFIAYPEAIATMKLAPFWAIILMLMLITLGLDSTFGGLEAIITGILDNWPVLRKRRELFVLGLLSTIFLTALSTTTEGGYFVFLIIDRFGVPFSILLVVFCECVALCWFYGINRFSNDVKQMLGFQPGYFWRISWVCICPILLFVLFCLVFRNASLESDNPRFVGPDWVNKLGLCIAFSSMILIPICMIKQLVMAKGSLKERLMAVTTPMTIRRPNGVDGIVLEEKTNELGILPKEDTAVV